MDLLSADSNSTPDQSFELATISLKALASPDSKVSSNEVHHLYNVCSNSGFFFLADHGVPKSLLNRVRTSSRKFFAMSNETKQTYGHDCHQVMPKACRGYTNTEKLAPNDMDTKQLFDFGIERESEPGVLFTGRNVLPPNNVAPDFAKSNLELQQMILETVVPLLTRALAKALKIEDGHFEEVMHPDVLTLIQRVLHYPPNNGFAGKHTDNGIFTILIQETSESRSLEVFTGGSWVPIEAKEEKFVINLGDMLQYMTHGQFVSTPHKVVHSAPYSRISLAFFVFPNIKGGVVPIGEQSREENYILTSNVMAGNFSSIWSKGTGSGRALEL